MTLFEQLTQGFARHFIFNAFRDGAALAVSGGGDSMAMLHLLHRYRLACDLPDYPLVALTVDHGLRPEARDEIALVERTCAELGVAHTVLRWRWDGQGNLQARARDARRSLIGEWARKNGFPVCLQGHTRDDQAETVLMRLARGSGVDGLGGIARLTYEDTPDQTALAWCRPMLDASREDLRTYLRDIGADWAEDPSNENPRFDRVKARQMMAALSSLGLTPERLARTADHMQRARSDLDLIADPRHTPSARMEGGDLLLSPDDLNPSPLHDVVLRRAAMAIQLVAGGAYRPRFDALVDALKVALTDQVTLGGCLIRKDGEEIRFTREPAAVKAERVPLTDQTHGGTLWDKRWIICPLTPADAAKGLHVGALTYDGLPLCPDWRATGLPRATLAASPAVWRDDTLIAAPIAGFSNGWSATLHPKRSLEPLPSHDGS